MHGISHGNDNAYGQSREEQQSHLRDAMPTAGEHGMEIASPLAPRPPREAPEHGSPASAVVPPLALPVRTASLSPQGGGGVLLPPVAQSPHQMHSDGSTAEEFQSQVDVCLGSYGLEEPIVLPPPRATDVSTMNEPRRRVFWGSHPFGSSH
jgi:hypothetical protein